MKQEFMQRLWRSAAYWLVPRASPGLLFYSTQDQTLRLLIDFSVKLLSNKQVESLNAPRTRYVDQSGGPPQIPSQC